MSKDLAGCPRILHLSPLEKNHLVALQRGFHLLRAPYNIGYPAFLQDLVHFTGLPAVKVRVVFIEHEHTGIVDNGCSESDKDLLSPGELPYRTILKVKDRDPLQYGPDISRDLLAGDATESQRGGNFVSNCTKDDIAVWKFIDPARFNGAGYLAVNMDHAGLRDRNPGQEFEQGSLSAAIGTNYRGYARPDFKNLDIKYPVTDILQGNHGSRSAMK